MTNKRAVLWIALLAIVIVVRIWDPLHRSTPQLKNEVSAPIPKKGASHSLNTAPPPPQAAPIYDWPPRRLDNHETGQNAFLTNTEIAKSAIKKLPVEKPPSWAYGPPAPPPPPPPPPEPPPPLQVIGTWGTLPNMHVFLSGPQGTILAKVGETLLSDYQVQNITRQHVTLLQVSKKRPWQLTIPSAPNAAKNWPSR